MVRGSVKRPGYVQLWPYIGTFLIVLEEYYYEEERPHNAHLRGSLPMQLRVPLFGGSSLPKIRFNHSVSG